MRRIILVTFLLKGCHARIRCHIIYVLNTLELRNNLSRYKNFMTWIFMILIFFLTGCLIFNFQWRRYKIRLPQLKSVFSNIYCVWKCIYVQTIKCWVWCLTYFLKWNMWNKKDSFKMNIQGKDLVFVMVWRVSWVMAGVWRSTPMAKQPLIHS